MTGRRRKCAAFIGMSVPEMLDAREVPLASADGTSLRALKDEVPEPASFGTSFEFDCAGLV